MTPDHDSSDDDLGTRIKHAVSDVEPTADLGTLQRRTTGGRRSARPWLAVLGAAAAVAVIVTGIAVVERSTQPDTTGGGFPSPGPSSGPMQVKAVG
ncbi:MAG: hypothetical protein JWO46_538, partial [Nocardioidaceae bacterium]|nr:hypothetical protein [Nocardioidaceae bacterium]